MPDLAVEEGGHRRGPASALAPAELGERDRVERAGGDRVADPEAGQAGPELAGGLAGERDREHVGRVDVPLARLPRDPTGEDAGLARAGAGQDRERRGATGDRIALRRVEILEERVHGGTVPPGYDSHREPSRGPGRQTGQQKAPSSLRCVAARISSGPFPPTTSDPSPPGLPGCSASVVVFRFPRLPGVVPFGSFTAPDPSGPLSGCCPAFPQGHPRGSS